MVKIYVLFVNNFHHYITCIPLIQGLCNDKFNGNQRLRDLGFQTRKHEYKVVSNGYKVIPYGLVNTS